MTTEESPDTESFQGCASADMAVLEDPESQQEPDQEQQVQQEQHVTVHVLMTSVPMEKNPTGPLDNTVTGPEHADQVTLKETPSDEEDEVSVSKVPHDETLLSGVSELDESDDQASGVESKVKPRARARCAVGVALVLVLVVALVIVLLVTNGSSKETAASTTFTATASDRFSDDDHAVPIPLNGMTPAPTPKLLDSLSYQKPTDASGNSATADTAPTPDHVIIIFPAPTPSTILNPTIPTDSPTTALPTNNPTAAPSSAPVNVYDTPLFQYLMVLGTPEKVLSDPTTPQGQAYIWLMQSQVEQISVFRVPQRYAIVALDFALHSPDISSLTFSDMQNLDETSPKWRTLDKDVCDWEGVTCDAFAQVIGIKWSSQGLTGSLVREMALLSLLETVDLAQNQITGTVRWNDKRPLSANGTVSEFSCNLSSVGSIVAIA
jgi:hypothetical protein